MTRASASAPSAQHSRPRIRGRRLSVAALIASALLAVPTTASAASDSHPALLASKQLNISMQAQQKSNWCWAGSGNTIATWFGRNYSQNQFCNAAFNRQQGTTCPNNQATLGNVQNALDWAGINSGSYVSGWLRYSTVQTEIDNNRPIETRIQWSSGGGHMHVLYGYDNSNSWVYWGDPWPSSDRYNWASHDWYVNNDQFSWTHSLYRIGA
ncbi:C39 family peptidase [Streptomyces sp. ET3-23]|uniref:papain-like cysteine protease family protein n=1 Tax=Streptomyces sp. ET3-23 TaxID=2885643 RepID=UPI001D0F7E53|nr:papain-like cysteine protease family protein [Streptomyces sp. ET3-23]MCC2279248.1 C39 family peptidase [Streptomyces sp. ET3-23]